ncbi:hypothetical protein Ahy_B07g087552 [Arachis hypogaea]|uniref:Uncharacterized protein n=1 Tax=Arachis hypogaea TaxID=3818 RepID=A0A444YCF6_ARAHY|nr:hypothetical protein Ahy_B07g087552 [Arachis hypogaea]
MRMIAKVFNMSNQKKAIVEKIGFGALRYIPSLNVLHKLLRELILSFDLYKAFLETRYEKIYKKIIEGATLASLIKSVLEMTIEGEENLMKFKRTFILFI